MKNNKRTSAQPRPELETSAVPSLGDEIAQLAYSYWDADGRPEGGDMHYWLRAEREVLAQRGLPHPDEEGGA